MKNGFKQKTSSRSMDKNNLNSSQNERKKSSSRSKEKKKQLLLQVELPRQALLEIKGKKATLDRQLNKGRQNIIENSIHQRQRLSQLNNSLLDSIMRKKVSQPIKQIDRQRVEIAIKLQSRFRARKQRKIFTAQLKESKHRKSIFNELVTSEEKYLTCLRTLIDLVIQPCEKYLEKREINELFSNIQQIKDLSLQIFGELRAIQWQPNLKIFQIIRNIAPFFKIYSLYCNSYLTLLKNIEQQKLSNQKFKNIVKTAEANKEFQNQQLVSFLVKPIQRLPQYVLLLKEYKKYTRTTHKDYDNIDEALKLFEKVNNDNNDKMDQVIRNSRLFELQKQFGDKLQILAPKRNFFQEEPLDIIIKGQGASVIGYFMTDMILFAFTRQTWFSSEQFTHLQLSETSFVKPIKSENDSFMLAVSGDNQTILVITANEIIFNKILEQVQSCINALRFNSKQKNDALKKLNQEIICTTLDNVNVEVIGVDYRSEQQLNYNIYVVQVSLQIAENDYSSEIHIQFKEIFELISLAKAHFPRIQLPYVAYCKLDDIQSMKIIQIRSIQIQSVLRSLLTKKEFAQSKENQKILNFLGIPSKFYSLQTGNQYYNDSIFRSSLRSGSFKKIPEIDQISQSANKLELQGHTFEAINPMNQSVFRNNKFQRSASSEATPKRKLSANKALHVQDLSTDHFRIIISLCTCQLDLLIPSQTKTSELLASIANQIQLKEYFDFALIDPESGKILQEDEIIAKKKNDNLGYFTSGFKKLTGIFRSEVKTLHYRKILFLNRQVECELYFNDNVRLDLITNQAFETIEQGNYKLEINELTLILAFWYFIRMKEQKIVNIKEVLTTRYKDSSLKNQDRDQIIAGVHEKYLNICYEVKGQERAEQIIRAKQIMITMISKHRLYGVYIYKALHDKQNLEIGMKFDGLILNGKKTPLNQIEDIKSFGVHLTIQVLQKDIIEMQSDNGFQIYKFWREYQQLNEELQEFGR